MRAILKWTYFGFAFNPVRLFKLSITAILWRPDDDKQSVNKHTDTEVVEMLEK